MGTRKMACRKPRTSTATEMANQSHATLRKMGARCSMGFILSRMGLFGIEYCFEEEDADGREDDVVADELLDPGIDLDGVEVSGQNTGGGLHHREERRQ